MYHKAQELHAPWHKEVTKTMAGNFPLREGEFPTEGLQERMAVMTCYHVLYGPPGTKVPQPQYFITSSYPRPKGRGN